MRKTEQYKLLDSIFNKEIELQTKYDHKSSEYFRISDRFHEEKFDLLLPVFISYFCKYNDVDLLDKYLKIMVIEAGSVDELPQWALAQLFICQPNTVLRRMKYFNDKSLDWALEGYFIANMANNSEIENYEQLELLMNEYFEK
jgi:hypothetical protein